MSEVCGELPQIECYAGEMNQVFMNLLSRFAIAKVTEFIIKIPTNAARTLVKTFHRNVSKTLTKPY
jgi:hypothetical protein